MSFEQLPFVRQVDGRPHAWHPDRTNDYRKDCELGRLHFEALNELMLRTNNPLLLSRVLQAQVTGGRWDGVEIGFAQALSEKLAV